MPTLRSGDAPVRFRLPPGEIISVTAPPGSSASVVHLVDFQPAATVAGKTQEFGPYGVVKTLTITCTTGGVNWSAFRRAVNIVISPNVADPSDGQPENTVYIQTPA